MQHYKFHDGAYHLYEEADGGPQLVMSRPAMKDGLALDIGEKPKQHDPKEKPVPTKHARIAIAYYTSDKSVATHGDSEALKAWVETHNDVVAQAVKEGRTAQSEAALYVFKAGAPAEDINRALKEPAHFAQLIQ